MSLAKTKPVKQTASRKRAPKTPLEQFHAYWQEIEILQQKLMRREGDRAQILDRFERDIRPLEEAQCQIIYRYAERLITFLARKIRLMQKALYSLYDNDMASLVYRKFKGRSKKATDREFAEHLDSEAPFDEVRGEG